MHLFAEMLLHPIRHLPTWDPHSYSWQSSRAGHTARSHFPALRCPKMVIGLSSSSCNVRRNDVSNSRVWPMKTPHKLYPMLPASSSLLWTSTEGSRRTEARVTDRRSRGPGVAAWRAAGRKGTYILVFTGARHELLQF